MSGTESALKEAPQAPRKLLARARLRGVDVYGVWPVAVMVLIVVATSFRSDRYFTINNFENILSQIAPLGIVTMGQTVLLISAGLDLSVGYNIAFSSIVTGLLLEHGHPLLLAVAVGIAAATAVAAAAATTAVQPPCLERRDLPWRGARPIPVTASILPPACLGGAG